MCRMIAAPPGMKQGDVLDILLDMECQNKDGFGYGYVDAKTKNFVSKKSVMSLSEILSKKSKDDFFGNCFKHNGWVIFHMRKASRGAVNILNSHPFIGKNHIFCHNGTFKNANLVRTLINKEFKFTSSTDSEVAMRLLEKVGPKKFLEFTEDSGVFFSLKLNGNLLVLKSNYSADMKIGELNGKKKFFSSELPNGSVFKNEEMDTGYIILNSAGEILKKYVHKIIYNVNQCSYPHDSHWSSENYSPRQTYYYSKTIGPQDNNVPKRSKSIHEMTIADWRENRDDWVVDNL